ncbi:MAG: glycosyltransferase family 4 protein [Limisphaerales bacterium]
MRVLFVHERFGAMAGAEANLYLTATEFKRRGHCVGIIHGRPTGKAESRWNETFAQKFALNGNATLSVESALAEFEPDIVYVHKMADLAVIETLLRSRARLVRMIHDHDIYCMRSYKYNYFSRTVCKRAASAYCVFPCGGSVARNRGGLLPVKWVSYFDKKREIALNHQFNRLVVVSRYMRNELLRNRFDVTKIEIHPPVPRAGDPSVRSNFSDKNLILYAGQIIRGKGVDVLLRALALVKMPFECIILGEGTHKEHCEKLSLKLGLQDRVRFLGFVPQEQLQDFYKECSVVAISSIWPEPFATIGMEAMRYGLPVVAFDVGGISDWLVDGQNGYLVPAPDCVAYAERLERLLRDKLLARQMGENGLKLVNEKFSFDSYIDDLEKMFATVIRETPPQPVTSSAYRLCPS